MTGHSMVFHVLVQWLNFLGVALLIGQIVFRWMVLNRSLLELGPGSPDFVNAHAISQRELKQWMSRLLVLLFVVSVLDLIIRAEMMSRKSFSAVVPMLPLIVSQTHAGKVWMAKMVLLGVFGGLWFFIKEGPRPILEVLLLLGSAGLGLTVSLLGHAADKGDLSVAVTADWIHVMSVSAWAGGLVPLRFLVPKVTSRLDPKNRLRFEAAAIQRFSQLAVCSVGLLILAGIYGAWLHLRTLENFLGTPYGITLLLKLVFVLPVLVLGGLGRYYIRPVLQSLAGKPIRESFVLRMVQRAVCVLGGESTGEDFRLLQRGYRSMQIAVVHFRVFVALECVLLVVVLALTALLTQTSPPNLTHFGAPGQPADMQDMGM